MMLSKEQGLSERSYRSVTLVYLSSSAVREFTNVPREKIP